MIVKYDHHLIEKFVMQAEKTIEEKPGFAGPVEIREISDKLGLSFDDGLNIASYLENLGWVRHFIVTSQIMLTPDGFAAVAKLRSPPWRQLVDRYNGLLSFIGGLIAAGVFNLAFKLIEHWLLPVK